jgi:hypothetical protein
MISERQLVVVLLPYPNLVVPHPEVQRGEAIAPPRSSNNSSATGMGYLSGHRLLVMQPVVSTDPYLRPVSLYVFFLGHHNWGGVRMRYPLRQLEPAD